MIGYKRDISNSERQKREGKSCIETEEEDSSGRKVEVKETKKIQISYSGNSKWVI